MWLLYSILGIILCGGIAGVAITLDNRRQRMLDEYVVTVRRNYDEVVVRVCTRREVRDKYMIDYNRGVPVAHVRLSNDGYEEELIDAGVKAQRIVERLNTTQKLIA